MSHELYETPDDQVAVTAFSGEKTKMVQVTVKVCRMKLAGECNSFWFDMTESEAIDMSNEIIRHFKP